MIALKRFSLCRVANLPEAVYPFHNGDVVLMLGEIEHMPGHVAIALRDGRVVFGYHAEHFIPLSEDEV